MGRKVDKNDTKADIAKKLKKRIDKVVANPNHRFHELAKTMSFYTEEQKINKDIENIKREIAEKQSAIAQLQRLPEELQSSLSSPNISPSGPAVVSQTFGKSKSAPAGFESKGQELSPEDVEASAAAESESKIEEMSDADSDVVAGAGQRLTSRSDPLADDQIDDLMSDIPGYLGTVCRDEIPELAQSIEHAWNAGIPFGFITLTITRAQATGAGKRPEDTGHWVAVAVIPDTQQLAYYDSFGEPAPLAIKSVLITAAGSVSSSCSTCSTGAIS